MRRFELTDAQWDQIAPLLPPQKPRTGRPAEDHRQVLDGMLWILRTGAPWEDLPARYGPVGRVSSRFYRWRKAGVFDRVLKRLRPRRTAGDRGYSSPSARRRLRQRRIEPVNPTRRDQPRQPDFDKAAYRERNKVERLIGRLKQYRRIATRYEKRAANYLAMVTLGMTMLWLK
ncbi:transposase [Methylobacterium sp. SI9]|uniref:transposase n=1 Tax=Methylobacterium guangdongense TaxID=3138811 RepID=UPI00313C07CF